MPGGGGLCIYLCGPLGGLPGFGPSQAYEGVRSRVGGWVGGG